MWRDTQWAHAFVSAEEGRARLETPAGAVDVGLDVLADAETGTVDWRLAFSDGTRGATRPSAMRARHAEVIDGTVTGMPSTASSEICKAMSTALPCACCGTERTPRTQRRKS